jgi:hypothetical protein
MKMTRSDWGATPAEYKTTKADGTRWVLVYDRATGATVLEQVEIDYGTDPSQGPMAALQLMGEVLG